MSDWNWKPTPNPALGYTETAKVTDKVSLVVAPTNDPISKWGLYRVIQGEAPQPLRSFCGMSSAKDWAETAECKARCLDAVQVTDKTPELIWKKALEGQDFLEAIISDGVNIVIAERPFKQWEFGRVTHIEYKWVVELKTAGAYRHYAGRQFKSMILAKQWAESDECYKEAKDWMRRVNQQKQELQEADVLQAKRATAKQVAPELRIVLGYTVYLKDDTTAFCVGALKAIKEHFGPDWVSIMPVLVYQHGDIEDLGQIIDQKA